MENVGSLQKMCNTDTLFSLKLRFLVLLNANSLDGAIIQSGVFNNLMGSMNDGLQGGDLDMGKLLGSVQGMVTSLNDEMKDTVGDNPAGDMTEMLNHMNGMMGMMSKMSGQMKNAGLDVTEMPEGLEEDMKKLNNMKFD